IVGGVPTGSASPVMCWDGVSWQPMGLLDAQVSALAIFQGQLVAGGWFTVDHSGSTDARAIPVSRIARWDGSHWAPFGDGMDGPVFALAEFNGQLFAGGQFALAGGMPANNVARWNGSAWSPLSTGVSNSVKTLAVYNGSLFAGGSFTHAGSYATDFI